MVGNLLAEARDRGSIPAPGRFHILRAAEPGTLNSATEACAPYSLCSATREAITFEKPVQHN